MRPKEVPLGKNPGSSATPVLNQTDWRISGTDGAAEFLELKPSMLTYRMKDFEIERKD